MASILVKAEPESLYLAYGLFEMNIHVFSLNLQMPLSLVDFGFSAWIHFRLQGHGLHGPDFVRHSWTCIWARDGELKFEFNSEFDRALRLATKTWNFLVNFGFEPRVAEADRICSDERVVGLSLLLDSACWRGEAER